MLRTMSPVEVIARLVELVLYAIAEVSIDNLRPSRRETARRALARSLVAFSKDLREYSMTSRALARLVESPSFGDVSHTSYRVDFRAANSLAETLTALMGRFVGTFWTTALEARLLPATSDLRERPTASARRRGDVLKVFDEPLIRAVESAYAGDFLVHWVIEQVERLHFVATKNEVWHFVPDAGPVEPDLASVDHP